MDEIGDPTSLIILDEADRLRMASLEKVRAIFDQNKCGVVLIGMPGIEKRMARYPQFYSRIGFVHEFRPLGTGDMRWLFAQRWAPSGVKLPDPPWSGSVAKFWGPLENGTNASVASHVRFQVASF